jgi:hypothetical protein
LQSFFLPSTSTRSIRNCSAPSSQVRRTLSLIWPPTSGLG